MEGPSGQGEKDSDPELYLNNEPADLGNAVYIEVMLSHFEKKYSYEELSGLSPERLNQEEQNLLKDFRNFINQFPDRTPHDNGLIRASMRGDDYRGLEPLTVEQQQKIRDYKSECYRNLDRAIGDANERHDEMSSSSPLSRFAQWLNEFVDSLTPVFGRP